MQVSSRKNEKISHLEIRETQTLLINNAVLVKKIIFVFNEVNFGTLAARSLTAEDSNPIFSFNSCPVLLILLELQLFSLYLG